MGYALTRVPVFVPHPSDDTATPVRHVVPELQVGLTWVDLVWFEKRIERWIRFGPIAEEEILDRRRRRVAFGSGNVFAFVRWAANDVGTIVSRIDIVQTITPGEPCSTVPGVTPGGELLLRLTGWGRVQKALRAIDAVEALGLEASDVAPDHWRHVHNRLMARAKPRSYTLARHRAWLLRRELER